jgi:hypothetical protein
LTPNKDTQEEGCLIIAPTYFRERGEVKQNYMQDAHHVVTSSVCWKICRSKTLFLLLQEVKFVL